MLIAACTSINWFQFRLEHFDYTACYHKACHEQALRWPQGKVLAEIALHPAWRLILLTYKCLCISLRCLAEMCLSLTGSQLDVISKIPLWKLKLSGMKLLWLIWPSGRIAGHHWWAHSTFALSASGSDATERLQRPSSCQTCRVWTEWNADALLRRNPSTHQHQLRRTKTDKADMTSTSSKREKHHEEKAGGVWLL